MKTELKKTPADLSCWNVECEEYDAEVPRHCSVKMEDCQKCPDFVSFGQEPPHPLVGKKVDTLNLHSEDNNINIRCKVMLSEEVLKDLAEQIAEEVSTVESLRSQLNSAQAQFNEFKKSQQKKIETSMKIIASLSRDYRNRFITKTTNCYLWLDIEKKLRLWIDMNGICRRVDGLINDDLAQPLPIETGELEKQPGITGAEEDGKEEQSCFDLVKNCTSYVAARNIVVEHERKLKEFIESFPVSIPGMDGIRVISQINEKTADDIIKFAKRIDDSLSAELERRLKDIMKADEYTVGLSL